MSRFNKLWHYSLTLLIVSLITILGGCSVQAEVSEVPTTSEVVNEADNIVVNDSNVSTLEMNPPKAPPDGEVAPTGEGGFNVEKGSAVETTGVLLIDGTEETLSDLELTSEISNESTIKITNDGIATLTDSNLNKVSGEMTVEEASDFFGANSGVLVNEGSSLMLENTIIKTTATGGNAIFVTGEGSYATLSDVTISTTKDHSRGLDVTFAGEINAKNISITTEGAHSAAVATDRGEGTIIMDSGTLNTSGEGSPCIYSTGSITVSNTNGLALGAQIAAIEGKNSITVESSKLSAIGIGRGNGGIDNAGVLIYQSMSGDANTGVGAFTAMNSKLEILSSSEVYLTAPMFFVTNTEAQIFLTNNELHFGSDLLLNISGNDGEWGQVGSNGGNVDFVANDQNLEGEIQIDEISALNLRLMNSHLISKINTAHVAKAVNVVMDSASSWNLTGDSYIDTLTDEDSTCSNIFSNGFNLYYDETAAANAWLEGKKVELNGGGQLLPQ